MASIKGSDLGPSGGGRRGSSSYLSQTSPDEIYYQTQYHEAPKSMSAAAGKMERRRRGEVKRAEGSSHRDGDRLSSASSMPSLLDSNQMTVRKSGNTFLPDLGSSRNLSQSSRSLNRSSNDLHQDPRQEHIQQQGSLHRSMNDVRNGGNTISCDRNDINDTHKSWQDVNGMHGSRPDIYPSVQDVNGLRRSRNDVRQSMHDVNPPGLNRSANDLKRSRQDVNRSSQDIGRSSSKPDVNQSQTDIHRSMYDLTRVGRSNDGRNRNDAVASVHRSTQDLNRSSRNDRPMQDYKNSISRSVHDVRNLSSSRGDVQGSWGNDVRGYDKNISRSAGNINRGSAYSIPQSTSMKDFNGSINGSGSQREVKNSTPQQSMTSVSSAVSSVSVNSQGPKPPARRGFNNSRRGRKGTNVNSLNNASSNPPTSAAPAASATAASVAAAGYVPTSAVGKVSRDTKPKEPPHQQAQQLAPQSAYIEDKAGHYQNGVPMRKQKAAPAPPQRPVSQQSEQSLQSYHSVMRLPHDLHQSYNSVYSDACGGTTFQVQAEVIPESLIKSQTSLQSDRGSITSAIPPQHSESITNIVEESYRSYGDGTMTPAASVTTLAFSELDDDDDKALLSKAISSWSLLSNGALVPGLPFHTVRFVFPFANLILMSMCAIFVSLSLGDSYWLESNDGKWWFGFDGIFNGECQGSPLKADDGLAKGSFAMIVLSFIAQIVTLAGAILSFALSQGYIKIYSTPRLAKWSLMASLVSAGISALLLIVASAMFSSLKIASSNASLSDSFILAIVAIITLVACSGVLLAIIIRQRKRL